MVEILLVMSRDESTISLIGNVNAPRGRWSTRRCYSCNKCPIFCETIATRVSYCDLLEVQYSVNNVGFQNRDCE